jgi:hypothetical protein
MAALQATLWRIGNEGQQQLTLLDLVQAVSAEASSEAEVVAAVLHLIRSGRVRLCGSFRGSLLEDV